VETVDRLAAAEAELALYRDAFENMPQGLCVFGADGRIALVNSRYEELLRLPPKSVRPGQTGSDILQLCMDAGHYPDTTLEELSAQIKAQLGSGAQSLGTLVRGDRSYAMKQSATPEGNLVTTCEDITGQVEAEGALRGSTARLNAILDAMPDCVKIFDESGRLIHINPRGLELLQAPDFDSLSTPGYSPVPPEYLDACLDVHRRVMAGESLVWTYEVIGLLGRRRHVEAHAVPFLMPDGATTHLCISRDVEERQNAAEALRASEERLRLVQDATGLADFELDAQGLSTCSDRFFEQLGLPVGDPSVGGEKGWIHLVHPEDRQRILKELQDANEQQQVWSQSEFRIVRADNEDTRWIACSTKMERDAHGGLIRMIGGHLDITERKEAENALRRSEERLRLVQEATGLADFEATKDGIAQLSERFIEQTGLPPGTIHIPHEQWMRIVHPDDRERQQRDIARSLEQDQAFSCEFRIIRPDNGEVRWISSRTKVERDATGAANRIGGHLDITERKNAEEALRDSEERFRLAAEAAGLGVWDYDLALDRREWSGRLREILGVSPDVEPSMAAVTACIHPADREKFQRTLREAHTSDVARFEASFRILRANDGAERWITLNSWRTNRADNSMRRIITTVRDVTDEKTAEERVRWTASHDPLTRLANRGLFQEKLDQAIRSAASDGGAVGLLLLDLDHFKQINDTLGHDAGDMLLRMFAKRLHGVVRAQDTVARFGGDEFAIVVPDIHTDQSVIQLSESIQDRLREPFVHEGRLLDCRVSIGASLFPEHGRTSEELLKNADFALYASKAGGRGMVSLFAPHMRDNVRRRSAMVQLARNAFRDDRMVPFYQPKLDLGEQKLVGFEALLRWRMPNGRIGSPAAIEAAFEDLEVAAQISDRMIERVIADMRGWLDRGVDFQNVAVNASAAEFRRDNFAERVLERLHRADIPTRYFQLEVTETVFLGRGAEYVHRALALLSQRGVKIALDDFGTGYASLRHLKQFPVDIIKIDQSFVRDMEADPGDEAIVRAVINLGRSLGIKVVAEGIERVEQSQRLIELECDFGQGFLFSKAVPASRVPSLVERWPGLPEPRLRHARELRLVANRH
jgi:diguanylate cyclase (GGDEF)-like protein/PAS domain S-box-containing protein